MTSIVVWKKLPNKQDGEIEPIDQFIEFADDLEGRERMISFHMTLEINEGYLVEMGSIKIFRPGDLSISKELVKVSME